VSLLQAGYPYGVASQGLVGLLGGISCLLVTTLGHAECTMDNDARLTPWATLHAGGLWLRFDL
jgi:hypothetical protein